MAKMSIKKWDAGKVKIKKTNKMESKGLGDTIEKITTATGIKRVVSNITRKPCGCGKRKEKLNKVFPYSK